MTPLIDPCELESRGIERLSVVYGVVPVHKDGRPLKQYATYANPSEYPTRETPRKVTKGLVVKEGEIVGLFRDIKVSWQPNPVGRASLSRGVTRWPSTAELFTLEEITGVIERDARQSEHTIWGRESALGPTLPSSEDMVDRMDQILENPLGNIMLQGYLDSQYAVRIEHARTLFRENIFYPALPHLRPS